MAEYESDLVNRRYRLTRLLGQGGMGSVYLAADLSLEGRPIALKRIHGEQLTTDRVSAFKTEFESMTRLRHPNVVEVYDFGTDEAGPHVLSVENIQGTGVQPGTP